MLQFEAVSVHYGKNRVLTEVSIAIGAGEIVALVGANAAGKTTTLRTALGLKAPSAGRVRFDGEDITRAATPERVRRRLVLVPEGRQVFVKFTVAENLLMGGYRRGDRRDMQADFDRIYAMFPRLAERRRQLAGSLSGGEQQILAIGRGLMAQPRCLLLDEPTLGLAPILVEEIAATVRRLAADGVTILLAEQNAAMALRFAEYAYVMESGRVVLDGQPAKLRANEDVKEFYLGLSELGARKSYREVKHYKRRKRWLS
jgi:branched-chain amino acid transport system ATP-binding protein